MQLEQGNTQVALKNLTENPVIMQFRKVAVHYLPERVARWQGLRVSDVESSTDVALMQRLHQGVCIYLWASAPAPQSA